MRGGGTDIRTSRVIFKVAVMRRVRIDNYLDIGKHTSRQGKGTVIEQEIDVKLCGGQIPVRVRLGC